LQTGRKCALLIGNSNYRDRRLAKLSAPAVDIAALADVLRDPAIGGFDDVQTVIDGGLAEVQPRIGALFVNRHRDDLVLLYFSGHGVLDKRGHLFLALPETESDNPLGTALSSGFVKQAMDGSGSRRQVLILDCCHSGAFGRTKGGATALTEETFEVKGYGREILTATSETEFAWENDSKLAGTQVRGAGPSVFTQFLVEGLRTGANAGDRDTVSVGELYDYVYHRVKAATPNMTPHRWADRVEGRLVIARNPHPVIRPAELPAELQAKLRDTDPIVREGAVAELGRLASAADPRMALAARNILETLEATERDRHVHDRVRDLLDALDPSRRPAPERPPILLSWLPWGVAAGLGAVLVAALLFLERSPGDAALERRIDQLTEALQATEVALDQEKAKVASLTADLEDRDQRLAEADEAQAILQAEKQDLTARLAELDQTVQRLQQERQDLSEQLNATAADQGSESARAQSLASQVEELTAALEAAQADLAEAEDQRRALEAAWPRPSTRPAPMTPVSDSPSTGPATDPPASDWTAGETFQDCEVCPEMVVIPAGTFMMGSPEGEGADNERPQHEVTIPEPLAVGRYEVTFDEWEACVVDGGCDGHRPDDEGWGRGNRPVIKVSWNHAQSYVDWLSEETGEDYRLLSEAEWEYAARAGTTTKYWWGDDISPEKANYGAIQDIGPKKTTPVGSYPANPWGLFDVHGNVWEWVEDCWNDSYQGAPADGSAWTTGDCSRRVLRGGSWFIDPEFLRAALRTWNNPDFRYSDRGFRVARTL
jgi:formylglycine-generating enzyme required for sulfatase activity